MLSTHTKRAVQRKSPAEVSFSQAITPLPRTFTKFVDTVPLRVRTTINLANTASGLSSKLLVLSPQQGTTAGYIWLGNALPVLNGLAVNYCRFMISHLSVTVVPVTPITEGGYVAVGFEADNSGVSNPPVTLADVTTSIHSDVAQMTEMASISVKPAEYFNEWKTCDATGSNDNDEDAGVVQFLLVNYRAGPSGTPPASPIVGLAQIEVDIHFAGLRSLT